MKKINLKGISEVLSERDLKNIIGGLKALNYMRIDELEGGGGGGDECPTCQTLGGTCCFINKNGVKKTGTCEAWFPYGFICNARDYTCC